MSRGTSSQVDVIYARSQQKKDIMKEFVTRCDTVEQFWLVRILLKNLKISIRERSILSRFHPDAYALFEVTTDLRTVAYRLYDQSVRLRDADNSVHLFQVFQPMLCKRNSIPDVQKKMPRGRWVVEEKMDGERIQLHRKGDKYKYWSRWVCAISSRRSSEVLLGRLKIILTYMEGIHTKVV